MTQLTWPVVEHLPVALYRIEGGGHGGPQYQSAGVVGPIPRHLDATRIM
jgi:poly(3-hydroxybutyrate) depolymerase